jgi:hypothetical protein
MNSRRDVISLAGAGALDLYHAVIPISMAWSLCLLSYLAGSIFKVVMQKAIPA